MTRLTLAALLVLLVVAGCTDTTSHATAVYMLLDTSGTYRQELDRAQRIIDYLLATLQPGDSLVVARIDSGSFSEKDIICKMTFDGRPSVANQQKRRFRATVDEFVNAADGSPYTDITGGVVQGAAFLRETGAGHQRILIFSDLKEELPQGHVRDFPLELAGCEVVALNVTKLRSDNVDPREYFARVDAWQERVTTGGGTWQLVNDLDNLHLVVAGR
jgi:hypothetical protein